MPCHSTRLNALYCNALSYDGPLSLASLTRVRALKAMQLPRLAGPLQCHAEGLAPSWTAQGKKAEGQLLSIDGMEAAAVYILNSTHDAVPAVAPTWLI